MFDKGWICIFIAFFLFFFAQVSFSVSTKIFLEEINMVYFYSLILFVNSVSLIIMPLIVSKMATKFGNVRLVEYALFLLALVFFLTFFFTVDIFIFVIFLILPFFVRIFNSSLNPYIGRESSEETGAYIFAVRDVFLYLGAAFGLFLGNIVSIIDFQILTFTRIFSFVFLLTGVILFLQQKDINENIGRQESISWRDFFTFSFNKIESRKNLVVFITIASASIWIFTCVEYYIIYLSDIGIQASDIFFFTAMSYFIVPIFALLSSIISVKKHKKGWYLFDIAFDMVSLSLILISGTYFASLIFITLIILNLRDFVYPISISYFFDCFEKDEMNDAWALHGTLSSIISLPIPLIAIIFYEINPLSIFFIALFIVPIQFFLALFFLPTTKEEENINKLK